MPLKNFLKAGFTFIILFCVINISHAGTVLLGAKLWYANWDSATLNITREGMKDGLNSEINYQIANNVWVNDGSFEMTQKAGRGYLLGPMAGYQTDDRKWSISAAFMLYSSFKQDLETKVTYYIASLGPRSFIINYDVTLERKEVDSVISRTIADNFKVFLGYKYQSYNIKINGNYKFEFGGTVYNEYNSTEKTEATVNVPVAGAGAALPIHEKVVAGFNLGIGYCIFKGTTESQNNYGKHKGNLDVDNSLYYLGDLNFSIFMGKNFIIQPGYKFTMFKLKAKNLDLNGDGVFNETGEHWDIFHGITLTAIYVF